MAAALLLSLFGLSSPRAAEPIRIAYVDPLSGAAATSGDQFLKVFQYIVDHINANGGALGRPFELVPFDSKGQPAEALIALRSAVDQGIPFILHCTGSNVGAALIDGVAKNNARNPNNRIIYLNCGALATELTNEQCDFWHFRFSGSVEQRALTLVRSLPKELKTVYLMNQDYLFGQSLQRDTKRFLAQTRPDIKIVGEEMIPFLKIKDFSSYVAKIKASGAQGLITGNWGSDINLLIKAGVDAGLDISYYTYLAHLIGGPTAVGPAGDNHLRSVMEYHENIPVEQNKPDAEAWIKGFRDKHGFDFSEVNFLTLFTMLQSAINKAGSTDVLKVALALEDLHAKDLLGNDVWMRKDDHQIIMPYYSGVFVRGVKYDSEHTGLGWRTENMVPAADLALPTICKMRRPAS